MVFVVMLRSDLCFETPSNKGPIENQPLLNGLTRLHRQSIYYLHRSSKNENSGYDWIPLVWHPNG